jgi:hypothetical protein
VSNLVRMWERRPSTESIGEVENFERNLAPFRNLVAFENRIDP